ncbi:MAG: 50S ribosomal protein L15e [Candidatus Nanoarchaeia archaeon]|jgi:large subunit ribosomal protein L15e
MGLYKFMQKLWKNPRRDNPYYREHLVQWRTEDAVVKVDKPTRIDRARSLGYKAKQGVSIARVRIIKGGRKRESTHMGRKPSKAGQNKYSTKKNLQSICEERAQRVFKNMNVLNSYEVGDDGKNKWYEVILIDTNLPQIYMDKDYFVFCTNKHQGRVFRGLTSAGKRGRGLHNKGIGTEKIRPSIRANKNLGK